MQAVEIPTIAQIEYAKDLIGKLGYNLEDYDLENMDKREVSELIGELKKEWEG